MAGIQVSVVRRTPYTVPPIGNTNVARVILGPPMIDTLGWRSGVLIVRLFSSTIMNASASVIVLNGMVGADSQDEILVDDQNPIASVTLGTTAQVLSVAPLAGGSLAIGRFVSVVLVITGNVAGQTASGKIDMAVDLIGRDA